MSAGNQEDMATTLGRTMLAAARLEMFAKKAAAQGEAAQAALYSALAASQQVQVRRLTMLLRGKVAASDDNLQELTSELLPGLIQRLAPQVQEADAAGLEIVGTALDQAVQVDVRQGELARRLGQGAGAEAYWLCPICGWLETRAAPERCPVCGSLGERFQDMAESS